MTENTQSQSLVNNTPCVVDNNSREAALDLFNDNCPIRTRTIFARVRTQADAELTLARSNALDLFLAIVEFNVQEVRRCLKIVGPNQTASSNPDAPTPLAILRGQMALGFVALAQYPAYLAIENLLVSRGGVANTRLSAAVNAPCVATEVVRNTSTSTVDSALLTHNPNTYWVTVLTAIVALVIYGRYVS